MPLLSHPIFTGCHAHEPLYFKSLINDQVHRSFLRSLSRVNIIVAHWVGSEYFFIIFLYFYTQEEKIN